MKIILVAGARPNFMKIASIVDAIRIHNQAAAPKLEYLLIHTGQHYDEKMSEAFFRDLSLPRPHIDLEVGSGSHAGQTAEIMKRFEPVLVKERPDAVLVVGDVNSTIACALVAAKIAYPPSERPSRLRPLIAHVEAGLRSFDRDMPEEVNRLLTDALSDLLFTSDPEAEENLVREGIAREKIHFVGNTMVDTLLKHRRKAQESGILARLGLASGGKAGSGAAGAPCLPFALLTLHRPSNVDQRETFEEILGALLEIARELPVLFPVHPRTLNRIKEFQLAGYFVSLEDSQAQGLDRTRRCIYCLEPLGYLDFLCLMSNARLVLTDSGGIQEETSVLGVPCVTLRENTERPITIARGTNVLAGTSQERILQCARSQLQRPAQPCALPHWDGRAGERIVQVLVGRLTP